MAFDLPRSGRGLVANFTAVFTGGETPSTKMTMNARMAEHQRLMVGSLIAIAIVTREVENETSMAMATTVCSVGVVEILKTNFIAEAQTTAAGVNTDVNRRQDCGRRKRMQE